MSSFTFTQLANPINLGYSFFSNPSINNHGAIVFEGFRSQEGPPNTIFGSSGGVAAPVYDSTQGGFSVVYNPSISDTGTTAFVGNVLDIDFSTLPPTINGLITSGVYSVGNNGFKTIADSSDGFTFLNSADINSSGTVTFAAGFSLDPTTALGGIYATNGGKITTIADQDSTFGGIFSSFKPGLDTVINNSPYSELTYPTINESGTVAFTAFLDTGDAGIFSVSSEGRITNIATSNDVYSKFSSAQINNKGQVAFMASLDTETTDTLSRGIFIGDGENTTVLADTSGGFKSFISDPSINDLGMVAFGAELDDGRIGIFTGADPLLDKVIAVGDQLAGRTVVDVRIHEEALNNASQIAFEARLDDGTYTVFRADPKAVPEPGDGIFSVLALAILFMLGRRWRHRKQFLKHAEN